MLILIRTSTVAMSLDILLEGQLAFLKQHYEVIAVSGEDDHLKAVDEREKVRTANVRMSRNISPLKDLISLVKLYFLFKKEKPHIVHSITPKAGLLSMLAAKFAGVPIRMHTFTGLIFPTRTGFTQKLLIKMDQLLCWAATNIYPEGNGVKKDLITFNITSKPLKILANGNVNGIDSEYFRSQNISALEKDNLRNELKIQPEDFVFIFVGRLVGDKGINELVSAFKNLSSDTAKLLLVGPLEEDLDPLFPEIFAEIEKNPNIISVGFQQDVRPYFSISQALVFPSYREGFPNVVIQAGAMGLPGIVSDINGCNEIVIHGKNGLIIPSKNIEAIKRSMITLLEDKELYMRLKNNSRKLVIDRYEQSVVWNALLQEYNRLLKQVNKNV